MADKVEIKELNTIKELSSINDLRVTLLEEIQNLRAGKTTPAHINAITNATGKVFSSLKLELEYAKGLGRKPKLLMLEPATDSEKNSN